MRICSLVLELLDAEWDGQTFFLLETCQRCPVNIVKIFACSKKLRSCYIALLIHVFQVAWHTHMATVDLQD